MSARENVPSPGQIMRERFMEPNGLSQADVSRATGLPGSAMVEILNGKRSMSPKNATLFGKAFGTSAEYWLDLDSRYQLSKVDADDSGVTVLVTETPEYQPTMYASGGYVYSGISVDDAVLGRAVRGVYAACALLNADDQEELMLSVQHYIMYQTIEFPGVYADVPDSEHMHREVFAMFHQFLIAAGENPDEVADVSREQWVQMVANAKAADEESEEE